jgi:hypothetical protein
MGDSVGMESQANMLRTDLQRYAYLRGWVTDPRVQMALAELISETKERLRVIEHEETP